MGSSALPSSVIVSECVQSPQSCLTLTIPWTVAHQAPQSVGFSRQEYWNGLPFPSSGDLPNPGIKPEPPALQADSLLSEPPGQTSYRDAGLKSKGRNFPYHLQNITVKRNFSPMNRAQISG